MVEQNGDAFSPKNGPDPDFAVLLPPAPNFLDTPGWPDYQ
jgi:hypothetical protein